MKNVQLAIIGGGPAGLTAAISAASAGVNVLIIEKNKHIGGQLIKQTHMFFGSEKQYASVRGIDIPKILLKKINKYKENIEIMTDSTVIGLYEDGVITVLNKDKYIKIKPESIVIASGASEKVLAFKNNDLPGIYGAGAVQTLMNVYGVKPGNKVVMVGAGNIGLIVSYQLLQAGVEVAAIVDASPKIGGYLVHASKVTREGVPIYTRHTIKEAIGKNYLEKVKICEIDNDWKLNPLTEKEIEADVMCISVGLTPLTELLTQIGCEMKYIKELGGVVPVRNNNYETSVEGIFVAGDVTGVEEASSAMVEGYIAGLCAANRVGYKHKDYEDLLIEYRSQLDSLRSGPVGDKIRLGISKIVTAGGVIC